MRPLLLTFFSVLLGTVSARVAENLSGNPCLGQVTCGKCITADPECAWCSQENLAIDGDRRCDYRGNLYRICDSSHVVVPSHVVAKLKNYEKVEGKYCECDNFTCDRSDGKICSGPERGVCECGKCKCLGNWIGNACDCLDDDQTCVAPNGKLCSGNGECVCGTCKCFEEEEEHYSGQFCEECPTCPGKGEPLRGVRPVQVLLRLPDRSRRLPRRPRAEDQRLSRAGRHPGHRAKGHRRHRDRGPGPAAPLEAADHHPRPSRVRQVREGETDGQVGHGREPHLQAGHLHLREPHLRGQAVARQPPTNSSSSPPSRQ